MASNLSKLKRWSELSLEQRVAIVFGAIVELVLTSIALGDLAKRPAVEVRGPKALWFLGCFIQPIGPVLYLRVGRRRS